VNAHWQLVLDEVPLRFLFSRTPAQRRIVFRTLDALKQDPYAEPHFRSRDSVGRELSLRVVRGSATFADVI
jgi:hypothetical protein